MYYGSYRSPRTLVWALGTVILILMMATAFLGYQHSPKWFDISNKESVNFNKKNVMNFKVNSKRLFNKNIVKRGYSTSSSSNSIIMSERLETIINELGLNLVYCDEKTIRRALQTEKKLVKRQWIVEDISRNK